MACTGRFATIVRKDEWYKFFKARYLAIDLRCGVADNLKLMSDNGSDEREFLHNLASPLSTALFLVDALLDSVQKRATGDPGELEQVIKIYKSLDKIKNLLKDRREELIKRGVSGKGP